MSVMTPPEVINHVQSGGMLYVVGPSEIVPELVPVDGMHWHAPEHVTVAGAKHVTHSPAPAFDFVPAGHRLHAEVPMTDLKVPALQGTHGPPFGPVYPLLH